MDDDAYLRQAAGGPARHIEGSASGVGPGVEKRALQLRDGRSLNPRASVEPRHLAPGDRGRERHLVQAGVVLVREIASAEKRNARRPRRPASDGRAASGPPARALQRSAADTRTSTPRLPKRSRREFVRAQGALKPCSESTTTRTITPRAPASASAASTCTPTSSSSAMYTCRWTRSLAPSIASSSQRRAFALSSSSSIRLPVMAAAPMVPPRGVRGVRAAPGGVDVPATPRPSRRLGRPRSRSSAACAGPGERSPPTGKPRPAQSRGPTRASRTASASWGTSRAAPSSRTAPWRLPRRRATMPASRNRARIDAQLRIARMRTASSSERPAPRAAPGARGPHPSGSSRRARADAWPGRITERCSSTAASGSSAAFSWTAKGPTTRPACPAGTSA